MFFARIAFFVILVLILLPSNTYEKAEFHRTVEQLGHNVATFCDRNVEVCDQTTGFFGTLYQKVVTTVEMLEDMLRGERSSVQPEQDMRNRDLYERRQRQGYGYDNGRYPTAAMAAYSQNTLSAADLRPAWNGPKPIPNQVTSGGKSR